MAHPFDVSMKTVFFRSRGVMSGIVFGGPIKEWLNVEQPDVTNLRVDSLARGSDGMLRHVEFQANNDPGMAVRELCYYAGFWRLLNEHVEQVVVYFGREQLKMEPFFQSASTHHAFRIVNLREMDGDLLLASDDWGDNELAILTKTDRERVIQVVEAKLWQLEGQEREEATRTFVLISGILGIEDEISRRLKNDMMTISMLDNAVLGPAIRQGLAQGLEQGRQEGMQQGRQEGMQQGMKQVLEAQLVRRFGQMPAWVKTKLAAADQESLQNWSLRVLDSPTLDSIFQ